MIDNRRKKVSSEEDILTPLKIHMINLKKIVKVESKSNSNPWIMQTVSLNCLVSPLYCP